MTYLTRYRRPLNNVFSLSREFDRWMDEAFSGRSLSGTDHSWFPVSDISETPEHLTFRLEVPGLDRDDIRIAVENNVLTVRGDKQQVTESEDETFYHSERTYGAFARSFSLPNYVDADNVQASMDNGVLTIRIARREETKAREIAIQSSAGRKEIEA